MIDWIGGIILWAIVLGYPIVCARGVEKADRKFRKGVEGWE